MRWMGALLLGGVVFAQSACGSSPTCEEACARTVDACDGHAAACSGACERVVSESQTHGCSQQLEDLLACDMEGAPACGVDPCPEAQAWSDCILAFCADAPTSKDCKLLGCGAGHCSPYGGPPGML